MPTSVGRFALCNSLKKNSLLLAFLVMYYSSIWLFHLRLSWCITPCLKAITLSIVVLSTHSWGGSGIASLKQIHISLVFSGLSDILFSCAHPPIELRTSWTWLFLPLPTSSSKVQSSAYLHILTTKCWGTDSSRSFTCTLKRIGEMTDPWRTPAGHGFIDEMESTSFTCWPLEMSGPQQEVLVWLHVTEL